MLSNASKILPVSAEAAGHFLRNIWSKSHKVLCSLTGAFIAVFFLAVINQLSKFELVLLVVTGVVYFVVEQMRRRLLEHQQMLQDRAQSQAEVHRWKMKQQDHAPRPKGPRSPSSSVTRMLIAKLEDPAAKGELFPRLRDGPGQKGQTDQGPLPNSRQFQVQGLGLEVEIGQLLVHICRTPQTGLLASQVVQTVSHVLRQVLPDAAVMGYVGGNPSTQAAFLTVYPEIHIVLHANWVALRKHLARREGYSSGWPRYSGDKELLLSALQSCTEQLVQMGGFLFYQADFDTNDPQVSLVLPPGPRSNMYPLHVDFCVNSPTQLQLHSVISYCSLFDDRVESLILLVWRWARDRSMMLGAGHTSEYAWAILTIFFMQTSPGSDAAIPPLKMENRGEAAVAQTPKSKSIAKLFKALVYFYANDFNWQHEWVSLRLGRRFSPLAKLNVPDPQPPIIEDPFESKKLSVGMTKKGLDCLQAELRRADGLCRTEASLSELLRG